MKVGELRTALERYDDELEVLTEGCDCIGDVDRLVSYESEDYDGKLTVTVLLRRRNSGIDYMRDDGETLRRE